MFRFLQRWSALGLLVLMTGVAGAQGGSVPLLYNEPVMLTLGPGQPVTATFTADTGTSFEIRLARLAEFTYTATLADPNQSVIPLTPGPDGNLTQTIQNVPVGGTYTLTIQAVTGSGDMLVEIDLAPIPIALGEVLVDLTRLTRYSLVPPADAPQTRLSVAVPDPASGGTLPALTLSRQDSGEPVLTLAAGALPQVVITLPAQVPFVLSLDPGGTAQQVVIAWETMSVSSGPCQLIFTNPVNVRSTPDANGPVLGVADVGSVLDVTGRDAAWWQVSYNNASGWVSADVTAATVQGDCSAVPTVTAPVFAEPTPTIDITAAATVPGAENPAPATVPSSAQSTPLPAATNTPAAPGQLPDLVLNTIGSAAEGTVGTPITIEAGIRNDGPGAAGPFEVTVSLGDVTASGAVDGLEGGGYTSVLITITPNTTGSLPINVMIDPGNAVSEITESNNSGVSSITITP